MQPMPMVRACFGTSSALAKKPGVGFDGALCQIHHMGFLYKVIRGLVESDMAVSAKSQKLKICISKGFYSSSYLLHSSSGSSARPLGTYVILQGG